MRSTQRSRASKLGLPPGTLVHIGEPTTASVTLGVIDFDAGHFEERDLTSIEELSPYLERPSVTWLNVSGVHDLGVVERVGSILGIHPLVLEDIVNTHQRPKAEVYEGYVYAVLKMIRFDTESGELDAEQVSLILARDCVVSFQEKSGDVFDAVRARLRNGKGRLRRMGADYLAYALIDVVVDHYFLALESLGNSIEDLEEELITQPSPEALRTIHDLKRVMVTLRKAVWPVRELVLGLERNESELMTRETTLYLRDVYDHAIQVMDTVETYRDTLSGYMDVYLSSVSNRMNQVMKVLTVISTVFIPLSFIAGVYGMNFEFMPELKWPWAYPTLWILMAAGAGAMLLGFRKKGWL
jgi:magnesium transporter